MAANELADYIENGNITNSVNFPNCSLPFGDKGRVAIIHKNIPNMISQFTKVMSDNNVNISDMINKSKGDAAYTIINADHELTEANKDAIAAIDGVLKVRIIK